MPASTPSRLDTLQDCVVIGGGPAGLTAAIFLGRYRRKVLVVDAGEGRNRAARGIHGFLGYDEIAPEELRARGRREAEAVGAGFLDARAEEVERVGDHFEIRTTGGTVRGRFVLLAFGVRDVVPDLPRFEEFYGRSLFHCPDCDGWEMRDRKIGVIGRGKRVAGLALELLQWTDDVTIFTGGENRAMNAEQFSKLEACGIRVLEDPIEDLVGEQGVLRQVRLRSGECVPCEAIFFSLGVHRSCDLAEQAGCEIVHGLVDVRVDPHGRTSVPGIYAAGDITAGSQLAIKAAADGAIAAIAINRELLPPARKV